MDEADLFSFAKARVANKGIAARIGHSAAFHSVRSALSSKGSGRSRTRGPDCYPSTGDRQFDRYG